MAHSRPYPSGRVVRPASKTTSIDMFIKSHRSAHQEERHKSLPLTSSLILGTMLLCIGCGEPSNAGPPHEVSAADVEVGSGEEALALLLEGNERFVAAKPRHGHESIVRRAKLSMGQHPYAIVLGCADSRVPPELLFDAGLGDLFVVRVAGNIVGEDEAGSIEYSIEHLNTQLVVVLGHEGCGAVTAALKASYGEEAEELAHLLSVISPAMKGIDPELPHAERVHLGVEANIRQSMDKLHDIQERVGFPEDDVLVVGAVYELDTGRVRILRDLRP